MKLVPKFKTQPIRETVPGKDVAVAITMSPAQKPCDQIEPCPPCLCSPTTVGWAIQPTPGQTYLYDDMFSGLQYERHAWVTPDLIDAYIDDPDGDSDSNSADRPVILRMATLPLYGDFSEATPPAYTNPHQSWLFLGLPFGDANDIRWEWTWDISQNLPTEPDDIADPESECWWAGEETEQVGSFLQVRILHGYYDSNLSGDWSAILTAKAYCGETEKGTLTLKIAMLNKYYYY